MSGRRATVASSVGLVAISALLVGCSGDSDRSVNVSPTTTVAGSTSPSIDGHSGDPSPTVPEVADAPELSGVTAQPTATACTAATIPVTVTFAAAASPPVRWFTVFVEGAQAGISPEQGSLTVDVPCDGIVHTILVIATGENGTSSTESVAVRTPAPS